MKKFVSVLLALALLLAVCPVSAEEAPAEENAPVTYEELEMYLDTLRDTLLKDAEGDLATEKDENGVTTVTSDLAVLTIADETLQDTSAVLSAVLGVNQPCPRGVRVGDTLDSILAVYPNDNPSLLGSYYDAALYMAGEKPEAAAGWLLRDGQRATQAVYAVYRWVDEGVIACGVRFSMDQGTVTGIEVFGMDNVIPEEEALQAIDEVASMQEVSEYFAYPQSVTGDTAMFDREDLVFAGLDLTDLDMEKAIAVLGEPYVDDWVQDSDGGYLRTRQWDSVSIVFNYDADKQFLGFNSMSVTGEDIEGPRGVRVGDMLETVMNRFHFGSFTALENGAALYGDGETAPYGVLSYSENTATLTYTVSPAEGQTVLWLLTFSGGELQEMLFTLR